MYAAVTGLSALSTGMQVISNNIANVNTVGFKAARTNFEDLISQDYWSNGKTQQIGRGVKVSTVQQMFTKGSFINSAQDTDMAIAGEGFFQVRDRVTNELMYTRAGNFTIDSEGNLETPAGYVLQGWALSVPKPGEEARRLGTPTDVKIIMMNAPPVETTQIKVVANLNADDTSAYIDPEEGWAEIYADQIARPPAERIGQLAADNVYSATVHGSAYPTYNPASVAFNAAYENYMTDVLGATAGVGTFLPTPTSAVLKTASAMAYASAKSAIPAAATAYSLGIPTSSTTFNAQFKTTYINRMSASGYSHFVSADNLTTIFYVSASAGLLANAAAAGNAAAGFTLGEYSGYPPDDPSFASRSASAQSDYLTAYLSHMTTSGYALRSASTERFFYDSASATTLASALSAANVSAKAAYLAISNPATFPSRTGDKIFDDAYNAKYLAKMTSSGYSYQGLAFVITPSATEKAAALAAATAVVDSLAPQSPATYPASATMYPSSTYRNAFNAAYAQRMSASGFSLVGASFYNVPPAAAHTAATASALSAAGLNPGDFTGYPATSASNPTSAASYNAAYLDYMTTHGGYTWSAATSLFVGNPATPSTASVTSARSVGHAAGVEAYASLSREYIANTGDGYYDSQFNAAYAAYLTNLGYTNYGGGVFERTPTEAEKEMARQTAYNTAKAMAQNAYQTAFDNAYKPLYDLEMASIRSRYAPWQLEGDGFAGAWDGTDQSSPIDPENYTHANPWTIYDSLGNAHTLMVYYQPNPHMENVWDYIITCDPTEDARKDVNNRLLFEGSTFAGLIQKGKITFTADGPDGHGGLIKDIEAQNIDLAKTAAARLISAKTSVSFTATANSMNGYKLGGYYEGSPVFSSNSGSMVASKRTYTVVWQKSLGTVPDASGFTWHDSDGNSGTIPVYDMNYTGPYPFGSGLNVSFTSGGSPMRFTQGDTLTFVAESESIGWTNLSPTETGYFDFDVAFVQSASMALHPPYPEGLPTIIQNISLDMGARNPNGENGSWILDEQGTTQYASESLNILSSQDGYPAGSLQRVSIDKDGILTGIYTNGRQQQLYQIGLVRFLNPWGLAKLGDNVYMETRWSGTGTVNPPGYGGTGTIRANFLEQSNTDLADEIVNMIVTQRGFQANSKVVTTTDTMLAEVIEMKR
jgi:flagellar hook-basal body protein